MNEPKHIVALSGGKDSTAMALRLAEIEPRNYMYCITPTGRELPEMLEHWKSLEDLLGKPLHHIHGPNFVDMVKRYHALPNFRMRFCTRKIKIEPFIKHVINQAPAICYVGIRADEANNRQGTNWNGIEGVKQDLPLARWGWGLTKVKSYLAERGIVIPKRTDCDLCFYQRLGEWWRLWRDHKDRWQEIEALETWTGHTLRSDKRDSWPASTQGLRKVFETGRVPKGAEQVEESERSAMCAWCSR